MKYLEFALELKLNPSSLDNPYHCLQNLINKLIVLLKTKNSIMEEEEEKVFQTMKVFPLFIQYEDFYNFVRLLVKKFKPN